MIFHMSRCCGAVLLGVGRGDHEGHRDLRSAVWSIQASLRWGISLALNWQDVT